METASIFQITLHCVCVTYTCTWLLSLQYDSAAFQLFLKSTQEWQTKKSLVHTSQIETSLKRCKLQLQKSCNEFLLKEENEQLFVWFNCAKCEYSFKWTRLNNEYTKQLETFKWTGCKLVEQLSFFQIFVEPRADFFWLHYALERSKRENQHYRYTRKNTRLQCC